MVDLALFSGPLDQPKPVAEKKRSYQRHGKPPYSYLALIAMVIQASPDKKLQLYEILHEVSALFPFFRGSYKGWKESIRHNLSSNTCFKKVLKDPERPQAKRNFWIVEIHLLPLQALKLQNIAACVKDDLPLDLAPYIVHGKTFKCLEEQMSGDQRDSNRPLSSPKSPKGTPTSTGERSSPLSEPVELGLEPELSNVMTPPSSLASTNPNYGSLFQRTSQSCASKRTLDTENDVELQQPSRDQPQGITMDYGGCPPNKVAKLSSNMSQEEFNQGFQSGPLLQHAAQPIPLLQHGTQHGQLVQHGPQLSPFFQHGPQPNPFLQHGSQLRPLLHHGPQPHPLIQHGPQQNPFLQHGSQLRPLLHHGPQPHPLIQHGPQPSLLLQHGPQLSPLLQHGPQPGPLLQHGPQPGPLPQHGTQPRPLVHHGSQLSHFFYHGSQENYVFYPGVQSRSVFHYGAQANYPFHPGVQQSPFFQDGPGFHLSPCPMRL